MMNQGHEAGHEMFGRLQVERTILELRDRLAIHTPYTGNDLGHYAELCVVGDVGLGQALRILREAGSLREAEQHVQQTIIAPPPAPGNTIVIAKLEVRGDTTEALAALRGAFNEAFGDGHRRGPLHRLGIHWGCR